MKSLLSIVIASFVALAAAPASAETASSRGLAIVAPIEEQMIIEDGGAVVISLAPVPALAEGERIVLKVDDQIVVLPSELTKFALTGVPLGIHVLEAIVVDADLNPVATADVVTFRLVPGVRT